MKRKICFWLIISVFLTGCASAPEKLSGEEIFKLLSPSTVEVAAESEFVSSLGSGFFIDDIGTVVTNYHVIEDCSSAYISTYTGKKYEVNNVLGYNKAIDIAIVSTSCINSVPVKISNDAVSTGETVYALGSSLGLTGTFSEGLVSSAERNVEGVTYIQISAPISHGNSGGPVVNTQGYAIGIASAGFEEGQNLNLALPISVLEQVDRNKNFSMPQFFEKTSEYAHLGDRVVVHGSKLAVRTVTFTDTFTAELVLALWLNGDMSESSMIKIMDEYGAEQGGGQLYLIDPGDFVAEIDAWCFDNNRQSGDYAIIENPYGYSVCYISKLN